MKGDDRLRALWREVAGPVPARDANLRRLASRIERDAAIALRARASGKAYSVRVAMAVGVAAALVAAVAVAVMPPQPPHPAATLIEAVSGREIPDGAWVIATAIRTNQ